MFKEKMSIVQIIILAVFALGFLIGLMLFSKGSDKKNNSTDKGVEYGIVNVWGTLGSEEFDRFKNKISKKSDKFKRSLIYTQIPENEFESKLINAIADDAQPQMIIVSNKTVDKFKKRIQPIHKNILTKSTMNSNYVQASEVFINNEQIMAFPLILDPMVMYYNRDIYSTNGIAQPAKDWTAFKEDISNISEHDLKKVIISGVAMGTYDNVSYAKELFLSLLLQTKVDYKNGLIVKENEASKILATLLFYTTFSSYSFNNKYYSWNNSMRNSIDMFTASKTATIFAPVSENVKIRKRNPNLNYQMSEIPNDSSTFHATYADIYGIALIKKAKNITGAYKALNKITSEEGLKELSKQYKLPSAKNSIVSIKSSSLVTEISNKAAIYSKPVLLIDDLKINKIFNSFINNVTSGKVEATKANDVFIRELYELIHEE